MHGHLGYQRRAMGLQDRTFSFARHGEARHNEFIRDGRDTEGRALLDPALTEAGEAQARQLAEALRPPERQFDIIVTSPLCRALQTASKIAETQDAVEVIVTSLHTETAMPPADPCQRGSHDAQAIAERYPRFDVARALRVASCASDWFGVVENSTQLV